jgi:hypothetical protein
MPSVIAAVTCFVDVLLLNLDYKLLKGVGFSLAACRWFHVIFCSISVSAVIISVFLWSLLYIHDEIRSRLNLGNVCYIQLSQYSVGLQVA